MNKKQILVVMAHQDDEAAFSTRIAREIMQGNKVTCVYLTDGAANGINPQIRNRESLVVLKNLGLTVSDIHFIGSQHKIPDGKLAEHLEKAYQVLEQACSGIRFHRIYAMAYEGGHHDHDACHVATLIFSAKQGLLTKTWQMPFYNGYKTRYKFFRVLLPVPVSARIVSRKLKVSEALRHTILVFHYKSQWRTWIGLLPELIIQRLIRRRETLQAVDPGAISRRPHEETMLYERLFGYSYLQFKAAVDRFLITHKSSNNQISISSKQTD